MISTVGPGLVDEHSVLLWQTCAYADDLVAAASSRGPLGTPYDAMLGFLHYRLLPYLGAEESALVGDPDLDSVQRGLRDEHDRIRGHVDDLDHARTRRALARSAAGLVRRLDLHVQREDDVAGAAPRPAPGAPPAVWALPLLLGDEIDLAGLPPDSRDAMVLERLRRMRLGETVLLHADRDLHPIWQRLHVMAPGEHGWAYVVAGPDRWTAEVSRRDLD